MCSVEIELFDIHLYSFEGVVYLLWKEKKRDLHTYNLDEFMRLLIIIRKTCFRYCISLLLLYINTKAPIHFVISQKDTELWFCENNSLMKNLEGRRPIRTKMYMAEHLQNKTWKYILVILEWIQK